MLPTMPPVITRLSKAVSSPSHIDALEHPNRILAIDDRRRRVVLTNLAAQRHRLAERVD